MGISDIGPVGVGGDHGCGAQLARSLVLRESKAITPLERVFVALMPLSMYATGATIGNGQLIIHLLPALLFGLLLLYSRPSGWRTDLLACSSYC